MSHSADLKKDKSTAIDVVAYVQVVLGPHSFFLCHAYSKAPIQPKNPSTYFVSTVQCSNSHRRIAKSYANSTNNGFNEYLLVDQQTGV